MTDIARLLQIGKTKNASDLHIVVDRPPLYRIHGSLIPEDDMPPLSAEDIEQALAKVITEQEMASFKHDLELEFGRTIPEVGRVRFNAAFQRGSISLVIRLLPASVPDPEVLGLPKVCKELIQRPRGLVVVSGPTGSGKSTTLASMIEFINKTESRRVITLEDPIEYTYENKSTITQRRLGRDTLIRRRPPARLRQDPDIILVGEMRDLELLLRL